MEQVFLLLVPKLDKYAAFNVPEDSWTYVRALPFIFIHSRINSVRTQSHFLNVHFHIIFLLMARFYRWSFLPGFPTRTLLACLNPTVRVTSLSHLILQSRTYIFICIHYICTDMEQLKKYWKYAMHLSYQNQQYMHNTTNIIY